MTLPCRIRTRWVVEAGVAVLAATGAVRGESATYRIMTYNVGSAAHIPLGPRQIGQIADTIIDNAVDVAGLCEVDLGTAWHAGRDHVAELGVALADRGWPMHTYTWPTVPALGGSQLNALLSRYPIAEMGYDTIAPPGKVPWPAGHITIEVAPGTRVRAYMTHVWPGSKHRDGVRETVRLPHAFDGPATIMGDFNLVPTEDLYTIILEQGWRNSCEAVHGAPCPSVEGQAFVSGPLPRQHQIDYIFGNDAITFEDSYVGYFSMSDHWPVFARVRVASASAPYPKPVPRITSPSAPAQSRSAAARAAAARLYRHRDYAAAANAYAMWESVATDADDAGFAAYSTACMLLLAGDAERALEAFERVIATYPISEWSVRSHYRRAFLLQDAGQWDEAECALLAYIGGYYAVIQPVPRPAAVSLVARQIVAGRKAAGRDATYDQILDWLAARDPDSMVARAVAWGRAAKALAAGGRAQAFEQFKQANPPVDEVYRDDARTLAEMWLEAGDPDLADQYYHQYLRCFTNPLHRRVRAARWAKQRFAESLVVDVPRTAEVRIDGELSDWPIEATVELVGAPHVYRHDPAAPADELSARVSLAWSDAALYVAVDVADSVHHCPYEPDQMWRGDCLQIAVDRAADATPTYNRDDFELGLAVTDAGLQRYVWVDGLERDSSRFDAAVTHAQGRTCYELALPWSLLAVDELPVRTLGFNLLVSDDDGTGRNGWVDWTPGIAEEKSPALYPKLRFGQPTTRSAPAP